MAASSTKSDLGKLLVNLTLHKIEKWATTEFSKIRHSTDFPVCIQLNKKEWAVGPFEIREQGQHRWQVTQDSREIHVFYSKQSAIFYTVFTTLHYYKLADNLLTQDRKVGKYFTDLEIYSSKLQKPAVKKDNFKYQLCSSRYLEAKSKFDLSKQELEKTLMSAKYNKIWEKII